MKAKKIEIPIACRYGEFGAVEMVATLSGKVSISAFNRMRSRLLLQENDQGKFFSNVRLQSGMSEACATINLYVHECQHFEIFGIFLHEMEKLTGDPYCIDCSSLHRPATQRKSSSTRKSK